jgi:hypothetical protein
MAAFIASVGGIGHLVVVGAEVVVAEAAVFKAVSMCIMAEWTKVNMGIFTRYSAWAKLDEFVQGVDSEVTKKGPEGEAGDSYGCWGGCPGVDGGGFSAVAVTAVGAAATVAASPLLDVLRWVSLRSQVG